ncbi:hypothetical protein [Aurantimonas sp. A3-2-R12]|uniref:hypothetical protein n=1 Tax=Aurantimonas sp. A3-2-R12 TaxID=3114362 RepID=UPI002E19A51D|nr:hypothetical protein [Aurantimonas sp. A3-2-R12]
MSVVITPSVSLPGATFRIGSFPLGKAQAAKPTIASHNAPTLTQHVTVIKAF